MEGVPSRRPVISPSQPRARRRFGATLSGNPSRRSPSARPWPWTPSGACTPRPRSFSCQLPFRHRVRCSSSSSSSIAVVVVRRPGRRSSFVVRRRRHLRRPEKCRRRLGAREALLEGVRLVEVLLAAGVQRVGADLLTVFFPNHPVVLGPRFEETVARVPPSSSLLLSSSLLVVNHHHHHHQH